MTATSATSKIKFRGRLFRVERGIRGSQWYSGATYTSSAAAEAAEARYTPYIEGHPAVGPLPVSLTEIAVDPRVRRKIAQVLAAGGNSFPVNRQSSTARGLRLDDFYELENLGLVRFTLDKTEIQTGPNAFSIRWITTIHLTPAGIAWATGA